MRVIYGKSSTLLSYWQYFHIIFKIFQNLTAFWIVKVGNVVFFRSLKFKLKLVSIKRLMSNSLRSNIEAYDSTESLKVLITVLIKLILSVHKIWTSSKYT
ncbi:hypothetical protein ACKWTF_011578 [Chironomus riparius]